MNLMLQKVIKSWRHFFMSFIGTGLLGIVVAFLTKSGLGTDPFTALVAGCGLFFHSTYQVFFIVITGVFLVVVFFWDKSVLGINTIINLFLISNVFALAIKPLDYFFPEPLLWQRILFLIIALVILCIASSLYIEAGLGVSSYDALAIIASKKSGIPFRWCRITTDLLCCVIGFLGHATLGVGTIITALCMGPFTQWCCEHISRPMLTSFNNLSITKED